MENGGKILALYDFASKQKFIYSTSKIKEISGASMLLSQMFKKFAEMCGIRYDVNGTFDIEKFEQTRTEAEVLYDGGGSLMVVFKDQNAYIKANRIFSEFLLKNVPGLSLIACAVPLEDDFEITKKKLFAKNKENKNRYPAFDVTAVMPFTQVDTENFLPVVKKENKPQELSLSADRVAKRKAFDNLKEYSSLDSMDEGLFAVVYIDGNSMGKKLMSCSHTDINEGVKRLREFSRSVNKFFVEEPYKIIKESVGTESFREIIGGGDEITFICKAESALKLVKKYFEVLKKEKMIISGKEYICTSCAGISVFHAKTPFNIAYELAEAACESAKDRAHKKDGNYLDFYYAHGSVTDNFDTLRERDQAKVTARPYSIEEIIGMETNGLLRVLRNAGRSNVKALGAAAQVDRNKYRYEVERVNGYLPKNSDKLSDDEQTMKIVYDISEFFDLWFAKGEQ